MQSSLSRSQKMKQLDIFIKQRGMACSGAARSVM